MLSTPQPNRLRFALAVPQSTARLRFSAIRRAVTQHELNLVLVSKAGTHLAQHELNLELVSKASTHFDGKHKLETV